MKLNDPFGRVSKRNQRNYQSLRDRLQQEGIRYTGENAFSRNMTATAMKVLLVLLGASLALAFVFPQFRVAP